MGRKEPRRRIKPSSLSAFKGTLEFDRHILGNKHAYESSQHAHRITV